MRQKPAVITRVRFTAELFTPQNMRLTATAAHTKASPPIVGVPLLSLCSFTYPRMYCPAFNLRKRGVIRRQSTRERKNAASAAALAVLI